MDEKMKVFCDEGAGQVTTDDGVEVQFSLEYDENTREYKPVIGIEERVEHGDDLCDELVEILEEDPEVLAEADAMEREAREYTRNPYAYHGVKQSDFY